ncbi:hypothetical protein [Methylibium sp. Pch-M]|uniref:hypothetical protein n=1 Tax=Methylibium sp. Pch-M TaxID=2082386 RepID=UPI0013EA3C1F
MRRAGSAGNTTTRRSLPLARWRSGSAALIEMRVPLTPWCARKAASARRDCANAARESPTAASKRSSIEAPSLPHSA